MVIEAYQEAEMHARSTFITNKKNFLMPFFDNVLSKNNGSIMMSQDELVKRLKLLPTLLVSPDLYWTVLSQLLFISQSPEPDIAYGYAQLYYVKVKDITKKDFHALNETVQYLKGADDLKLKYLTLDQDSLRSYVFLDSNHSTNKDYKSQLCRILCLVAK